ncbi:hypothetical protein [Selenomonas sp.]|uniref:hypothetical protein n=1 Tax=Selenomonas sp. TaxID=2053611 RepID=UPI002A74CA3D|nr:hypothetical protein [Selenomonas sp.]MDY3298314.1 hypothetical protein [Selenomonas sp.]MDY4415174.1 hypothetical protein [Selenomonas sp.]
MKQETMDDVEAALADWAFADKLPADCAGFHFSVQKTAHGDMYDIFSYDNPPAHKSVTAYFHEETHEYKLRVRTGFIEFCRIEFITADLATFAQTVEQQLTHLLESLVTFDPEELTVMVRQKGILTWPYASELPETLEGYTLFVRPSAPVKITNGSYILIDYVDFEHGGDVTIYYNMYRDEFFGEARVHAIPDVTYDFDSHTLDELQQKLEAHLVERMKQARAMADAETEKRKRKAAEKEQPA